jgi:ParB family chromosome partitioning protein
MELELHQLELRYEGLRRRCARREKALLASLSEVGQQAPVLVVAAEGGGERWVLVDGYKRVRALRRLKQDTVRAVAWELAEAEALLLERVMRTGESESALEQGWLLRELNERFGLTCEELARRFDKSMSWVSRRLGLVKELPEAVQEQVRRGELVAHAAMKHLVPLARANRRQCEELAGALAGGRFSSREVGRLCKAWQAGTEESRKLILSSPALVLRAQEEARRPAPTQSPVQRLREELLALAAIARRAMRMARQEALSPRAEEAQELHRCLLWAEAETQTLFSSYRKELRSVGPEYTHGHSQAE